VFILLAGLLCLIFYDLEEDTLPVNARWTYPRADWLTPRVVLQAAKRFTGDAF
jgi:hypothetical protein